MTRRAREGATCWKAAVEASARACNVGEISYWLKKYGFLAATAAEVKDFGRLFTAAYEGRRSAFAAIQKSARILPKTQGRRPRMLW